MVHSVLVKPVDRCSPHYAIFIGNVIQNTLGQLLGGFAYGIL